MIGIIVIAHERIAGETVATIEHVFGKQPLLAALDVRDSNQPDLITQELDRLLAQCDSGDGVLVMADMFGGTPCNVAIHRLARDKVEVLSGYNLPALIKAVSLRKETRDLNELARAVVVSGQQYMCLASDFQSGDDCQPAGKDMADG